MLISRTHISRFRYVLPSLFVNLHIVTLSSNMKLRPENHNYLFTQWTQLTLKDAYLCLPLTYCNRWKNVRESCMTQFIVFQA